MVPIGSAASASGRGGGAKKDGTPASSGGKSSGTAAKQAGGKESAAGKSAAAATAGGGTGKGGAAAKGGTAAKQAGSKTGGTSAAVGKTGGKDGAAPKGGATTAARSGGGPAAPAGAGAGGGHRRPALTSRAAILALVICVIALSLAYPLREYLAQRARIAELREEKAQSEQAVGELHERRQHLQDPTYIEREARTRLHYQYPGERAYVVVSDEDEPPSGADAESGEPWFTVLWKSALAADKPLAGL